MAKRIKKPPIKPEMRREWLRRYEENGESPHQIASIDKYDIRTVRKQIELAKQEREVREARLIVLRNALEHHYEDLRGCAEKLNSRISGPDDVPLSPDDELLEVALKQHLPRSPIWSYLSKLQSLHQKRDEQLKELRNVIEQGVNMHPKIAAIINDGLGGVIPGIAAALAFQADQWSQGSPGLNLKDNLVLEPVGEGLVSLRYGFSHMGKMDQERAQTYAEILEEVLDSMESDLRNWEAYHDLEKTTAEIERLRRKLREELAIIRLRRIVPGHCKYCPL